MSDLSKAYELQSVESKWYQFWLDRHGWELQVWCILRTLLT